MIEALVQLTNLTTFSREDREKAEEWLAKTHVAVENLNRLDGVGEAHSTSGSPVGGDIEDRRAEDELARGLRRSASE